MTEAYAPPPCPKCGSTRTRIEPPSYRAEDIDPKLRPAEYWGFITVCPDCGTQGMVDARTCKACKAKFEWIVTAWNSRPREYCDDPACMREHNREYMQTYRAEAKARQAAKQKK